MTRFTCSYRYAGIYWAFDILAESQADAEARVRAIRTTGTCDGEVIAEIPVWSWWRRLLGR